MTTQACGLNFADLWPSGDLEQQLRVLEGDPVGRRLDVLWLYAPVLLRPPEPLILEGAAGPEQRLTYSHNIRSMQALRGKALNFTRVPAPGAGQAVN